MRTRTDWTHHAIVTMVFLLTCLPRQFSTRIRFSGMFRVARIALGWQSDGTNMATTWQSDCNKIALGLSLDYNADQSGRLVTCALLVQWLEWVLPKHLIRARFPGGASIPF